MIHRLRSVRYLIRPSRQPLLHITPLPSSQPTIEVETSVYSLMIRQIHDYIDLKQPFYWEHPDTRIEDEFGIIWYQNQYKWWRPDLEENTYIRREECVETPLVYRKQMDPFRCPYPCFRLLDS